jgi:hypothetical protein
MNPLATKEVAEKRQLICSNCDRLFKPTFSCLECGCFMKIKTRLNAFSCPLEKWSSVIPEQIND